MESNLRLLEDRVRKAARRLRELSAERGRLHEEVDELRSRLEEHDRGASGVEREFAAAVPTERIADELRAAIRELRDE